MEATLSVWARLYPGTGELSALETMLSPKKTSSQRKVPSMWRRRRPATTASRRPTTSAPAASWSRRTRLGPTLTMIPLRVASQGMERSRACRQTIAAPASRGRAASRTMAATSNISIMMPQLSAAVLPVASAADRDG